MWQAINELATFDYFESLPDEIEHNTEDWINYIKNSSDKALYPPAPYNSNI